jgi:phage terminase large subunit-like protein
MTEAQAWRLLNWFKEKYKQKEILQHYRRVDPFALWTPFAKQMTGFYSKKRFIFYTGANQIGKTNFLAAYNVAFLTCRHPLLRTPRNAEAWFSVLQYPNIEQIVMPKLKELLAEGTFFHNKNKNYLEIVRGPGTGNKLHFKSQESGYQAYGGATIHLLTFDEEHNNAVFQEALQRVTRFKGKVLIGATLTEGMTWMYDAFWDATLKGDRTDVELIVSSQYENPVLDRKVIRENERILRMTDPDMADIRILGLPRNLSGKCFCNPKALDYLLKHAREPELCEFMETA